MITYLGTAADTQRQIREEFALLSRLNMELALLKANPAATPDQLETKQRAIDTVQRTLNALTQRLQTEQQTEQAAAALRAKGYTVTIPGAVKSASDFLGSPAVLWAGGAVVVGMLFLISRKRR